MTRWQNAQSQDETAGIGETNDHSWGVLQRQKVRISRSKIRSQL